jgi:integrase
VSCADVWTPKEPRRSENGRLSPKGPSGSSITSRLTGSSRRLSLPTARCRGRISNDISRTELWRASLPATSSGWSRPCGGGAGAKLINNAITLLGQVFDYGLDRGWCNANPARKVRRPRVEQSEAIRFLDQAEVEAMLRAAASETDRALFLIAVMTGLRQGELLGLQWRDVDWHAGKVHVRRSYVRGHWGTPKSRRSSRAVPMANRVARELARHHQCATYKADEDLVFCHPGLGTVLDHSDLVRRFKRAQRRRCA